MNVQVMEAAKHVPMRAIVRCKAKQQLMRMQSDLDLSEVMATLDETLFQEIATTLLQSDTYQTLYRVCRSKQEAIAVEDQLATELAKTYRNIVLQQHNPLVQCLNQLL